MRINAHYPDELMYADIAKLHSAVAAQHALLNTQCRKEFNEYRLHIFSMRYDTARRAVDGAEDEKVMAVVVEEHNRRGCPPCSHDALAAEAQRYIARNPHIFGPA
jgi:hypothetical protein